jgi:preprotein translocase subunit SecG
MSRIVKVQIQADTAQATAQVRELAGALSQLDAVALRNAANLMAAQGGVNPATLNPTSVNNQVQLANSAQVQATEVKKTQVKKPKKPAKTDEEKTLEANTKLAAKIQKEAQAQFAKFADEIGKVFADSFEGLFNGGLKGALKGFQNALKSMFQGILKQLIGSIAGQIKSAISKKMMESFTKAADPKKDLASLGAGPHPDSGTGLPMAGEHSIHSIIDNASPAHAMAGLAAGLPPAPTEVTPTTNGTEGGSTTPAPTSQAYKAVQASLGGVGKFQMQIASMLPGIGMSLGGMLGMGQTGPSLLGSAGGLMLGGAGAVALLGGTGAGTIFGAGGALASLHGLAAFMTNPFTIAAAGAILVGAIIWGINSRRKKEEKQRNQAMLDAFSQLDDLIKQVNSDQLDGASAVSQATQIRKQYVEQMSQLKDKKTRNIALKDVSRIDSKIAEIKQAGEAQTARKAMDAKLVPTFADGGFVGGSGYKILGGDGAFMNPFTGRVPGVYDRRDDFLARLTVNEVVLTPDVWMPIAPYLKQKRVPGFADGGMVSSSSFTGSTQVSSNQEIIIEELTIHLSNQFGADSAAKILGVGLKTPEGRQAVVRSVRTHIGENGLGDGLVRDINTVNERGF